ncbi:MAG: endonuclease/exonuclease/phosphatase family protein [Acidimicrobiales bacterium]
MRIATWNLERRRPTTPTGRAALAHLAAVAPDVAVLTEAHLDHLGDGWHRASAGPAGLSHLGDDERKVVIASRMPLNDVETSVCDDSVPGRFVAASVDSPFGPVRTVGVCIPWSHSRVRSGEATAWADHRRYLDSLGRYISALSPNEKVIVAGDFNQRIPRTRQPRDVAERLAAILDDFAIPTAGEVPGVERRLIDHVAVRGLTVESVETWPNDAGGVRMSDHDGVVMDLRHLSRP